MLIQPEEEWLEEVDELDRIVGRRRRSEIHRLGLRHRSVHILVFDSSGRLFLQKRSMSKDNNPGLWDTSAAGHVDPGESYEQSALREIDEELGISEPPPLELLFKITASKYTGWEFVQVYRAVYDGPMRLNEAEIDEGRWLPISEIQDWQAQGGMGLTVTFQWIWQSFCRLP